MCIYRRPRIFVGFTNFFFCFIAKKKRTSVFAIRTYLSPLPHKNLSSQFLLENLCGKTCKINVFSLFIRENTVCVFFPKASNRGPCRGMMVPWRLCFGPLCLVKKIPSPPLPFYVPCLCFFDFSVGRLRALFSPFSSHWWWHYVGRRKPRPLHATPLHTHTSTQLLFYCLS